MIGSIIIAVIGYSVAVFFALIPVGALFAFLSGHPDVKKHPASKMLTGGVIFAVAAVIVASFTKWLSGV